MAKITNLKTCLTMAVILLGLGCRIAAGVVIHVDANAPPSGDGTSWGTAYKYLQDALKKPPTSGDEIWVAAGTYCPDEDEGANVDPNDRTETFQLINGVALYGGFPDSGNPNWNDRDPNQYETILSGDLLGNNGPGQWENNNENSYHVVTGSGTDETVILDGFTITAGNANGGGLNNYGGGMYNDNGNPQVSNCAFSGNSANNGGGMYSYNHSGSTLTNCTFSGNSAIRWHGGGIFCYNSSPKITNCTISGNWAEDSGGGMFSYDSSPTLTNCTFSGNLVPYFGGGMTNSDSRPTLTNCTFTGNSAPYGRALGCNSFDAPSNLQLINCILWDAGDEIENVDGSRITITYSDVQGGWPGEGNIDEDPCFVDPNSGDYHLLRTSPCIDAANDANVYTDIEGNIRPFDFPGVDNNGELPEFDMGAYEATAEEAELMLLPRVINRSSRQRRIVAWLRLPEGITRDQIDRDQPLLLYPDVPDTNGIESIRQYVFQNHRRGVQCSVFAFFDKAELMDAVDDNGRVELQVLGQFVDPGQYFYGSDTVRIISRRWHRWYKR